MFAVQWLVPALMGVVAGLGAVCRPGHRRQLMLAASLLVSVAHSVAGPSPLTRKTPHEPRFESVGQGVIPRDVVPTFVQDRAGFFWIGTGDGLVRFDGYSFRPRFKESQDPGARNMGWIQSMLPGRDGRVWMGTETHGLAVYDPALDRVVILGGEASQSVIDPSGTQAAAFPTIRALAEDRDGAIYVGSLGGGLARFDPKTSTFTRYQNAHQDGALPDDRVQSLLVDHADNLWVGTWAGLSKRVKGSARFEPLDLGTPGDPVTALYEASDGHIWVGTQDGVLQVLDAQSPLAAESPHLEKSALRGKITSFVEAPDRRMWVGRVDGIQIFDMSTKQLLQELQHDARRPSGLAGNDVTTLMKDKAGWIWVGGFGVGLQRHDPNNQSIWMRGPDLKPNGPWRSADIRSLLQTDAGDILAATHEGPVLVLNQALEAGSEIYVGSKPSGASRSAGRSPDASALAPRVEAMAQTQDGSVWLGSGSAIHQFNRQYQHRGVMHHNLGQTRRLFASTDGSLWVGTQAGILRLPKGGRVLQRVRGRAGLELNSEVHVFAEAPDGDVWVGTATGLYRVASGELEAQPVATAPGSGLSSSIVIGLLFDSHNTLWVDTGVGGLHQRTSWDGQVASFARISERHGIFGRPFGANLLEDGRGRIWTHMYVYDPHNDQLHALGPVDGADLGTGWFFSYLKTRDSQMLFGGSKGVMVVAPDLFDVSVYAPPLWVSELRINGQLQHLDRLAPGLVLSPDERGFSVSLAALDYADPARLGYAYQLAGYDPDWIQVDSGHRVASYSNLGPGSYLLKARATNRSGLWSPHEQAIAVTVLPAWWQTWWFRGMEVACLLALIYGIVLLRTRSLLQQQLALEEKVDQRTSELQGVALRLQLAAKVFSHAREGILITDARGLIIEVNDTFSTITGYQREEVLGKNPSLLRSGLHDAEFFDAMWHDLAEQGYWSGEVWNKRKNGEVFPELLTVSAVRDAQNVVQQYVGLFSDITKRKQLEEQVRQMAYSDYLTNLPNRRILDDRLSQAIAASNRTGLYGALMFLDLDNFKSLNDGHGHEVGDLLLLEVARRLKSCIREMDTIARFGGDEFVVMLTELHADKAEAKTKATKVAEQIRLRLAEPYWLSVGHLHRPQAMVEHHCTASIGIALFGDRGASRERIVANADAAMYQAKSAGRNQVFFHEAS